MSDSSAPEPTIESVASLTASEPEGLPAISTDPTIKKTVNEKSSRPSLSSSPPSPSASHRAVAALLKLPSDADNLIAHLSRCIQTRAGADTVLFFICYAARFSSAALELLSRQFLKQSARNLVSLFFQLPPATTVIVSEPPQAPAVVALALGVSKRLKAVSDLLTVWRAYGRLFGLVGLYLSAKRLVVQGQQQQKKLQEKGVAPTGEERFDYVLGWAQVLALIAYQASENLAILTNTGILSVPAETKARLSSVGVRCWASYVGMELGRLLIERSRKVGFARKEPVWRSQWKQSFTNNLAWAPLTVHWSVPNGPLPEIAIGALALVPATNAIRTLWKSTI